LFISVTKLFRISHLPDNGIANLLNLETLNLASNQISRLSDHGLAGLLSLQTLSLASNRLVALPSTAFSGIQLLRELRLDNNSLTGLPPSLFRSLDSLLVLNLSRNHLTTDGAAGGGVFSGLRRLVALDLSHNRLEAVERLNLQSLTSLQILNLSNNRLETNMSHYRRQSQLPKNGFSERRFPCLLMLKYLFFLPKKLSFSIAEPYTV
jgi:Leucine-rich repeat (LRR) protein